MCFASGPGLNEARQTARDLRRAICGAFDGGPWQPDCIRHLEVVPSTEAEFQAARAALADKVCDESVFRLIVHCGVAAMGAARNCRASRRDGRASGEKRRRTDSRGSAVQDIPQADAEGPFLPPEAGRQPAAPLASYAGVVEDLPPTEFGALAAAVSEQHAALKASFQPPMNSERVLEVAKTGLVLLEAVRPLLANLARCVDDVSQRLVASATDEGFRAATHDALLALRRAHATAHPRRDRPCPRAARHTPATPGKDGSTPSAPAAETPWTAGGPGPRGCDSGAGEAPAPDSETPGNAGGGSSRAAGGPGGSCRSKSRRLRKAEPVAAPPTPAAVIKALIGPGSRAARRASSSCPPRRVVGSSLPCEECCAAGVGGFSVPESERRV